MTYSGDSLIESASGIGHLEAVLDPNNVFLPAGTGEAQESSTFLGLDPYVLLAGFIFSSVGLGAWYYGKKLELWKPKVIGIGLMLYPYFVYNRIAVWVIGAVLCGVLWFHHDE